MKRASFIAAFAAQACLFPSLALLEGGDAGGDSGASDGALPQSTLADAGHVGAATGDAQQTHVIWAAADKRWWLFYIDDDTTTLKTRSSPDFVTWTDGASLTLLHTNAGEGRNFSVAYASIVGADVVHVSFSHDAGGTQYHTHTRAVIQGGAIAFGASAEVCSFADSSGGAPDSPAALLQSDGTVWDSTGDVKSQNTSAGHYNEDVFLSSSKDTGTSWNDVFDQTTVEVVNNAANARQLLVAADVVALWEGGDQEPNPNNVHAAVFQQGSWGSPGSIFPDAVQDPNDWDGVALRVGSSFEVHVVRARLAGGYDHALGTTTATSAPAPETMARSPGSGLVLLADPDHMALVDTSADGSLQMSKWSQAQWSSWSPLTAPGIRHALSGYCPDLSAHPEALGCAVIWTVPINSGVQIAGMLVRP